MQSKATLLLKFITIIAVTRTITYTVEYVGREGET